MSQRFEEIPLFGSAETAPRPTTRAPGRARILITVEAAPNPSANYGETVCVAGLRLDPGNEGWVRLYPVPYRQLLPGTKVFRKYDIVSVDLVPHTKTGDTRFESYRPRLDTLAVERSVAAWKPRVPLLQPWMSGDMCSLTASAREDPAAQSLSLLRPSEILKFEVTKSDGWTADQQKKIDAFVNQLSLDPNEDRTPLEAPAFVAHYTYRCQAPNCRKHRQQLIDWEFLAFQRRIIREYPAGETADRLRAKWWDEVCAPERVPSFYVGNQAARRQSFSILGVFWPRTTDL